MMVEEATRDIIFQDYNVVIDGQTFFDQPVKINLITFDNIRKIATGLGDDNINGCLLDYNYFNNYYKMIAIGLSKQQALEADTKAIQQINFTENLDRDGNKNTGFYYRRSKRNNFRFFTRNC